VNKQGKILVFHLSRFGYADYAAGMIDHLPHNNYLIFLSKYYTVPVKKTFRVIPTYRNGWEFLSNSLFQLPLFLYQLHFLTKKKEAKVAYFPGFHYWDLPIILWCKARRIRVIYTVHDGTLHEGENFWHHRKLQTTCIRLADEIICLSNYVQSELRQKLHIKKHITVIPHGPVALTGMHINRKHTRRLKLLFFGRIGKYKGVEQLAEAVSLLDDTIVEHLTIAGKPLYKFVIKSNPKIHQITGWLSNEVIVELFNSHDVLVLPYHSASQSGVAALGIAAAMPMICTSVGALPEQLAENEAVWALPTPESLAEAISMLSNKPALFNQIHQHLKLKRKTFTWSALAEQLHQRMIN